MSAFDFAMTVATGTLIASVLVAQDPPLANGVVGLAAIFGAQASVAWLRRRSEPFARLVNNRPVLLMEGDRILGDNLEAVRVTEDDLRAKLREANVLSHDQIRAVVMETTGDISVLHGPVEGPGLDEELLEGVKTSS